MKYEYWFRSRNIVEPIKALNIGLSLKLINFSIKKSATFFLSMNYIKLIKPELRVVK